MDEGKVAGVIITPLKIISVPNGDVLHALKKEEQEFAGFGEAYFSTIEKGAVKAWKRHREMTLNLVVPVGSIRFVLYDTRVDSMTSEKYQVVKLSRRNYCRLTVPPMVWVGFQGCDEGLNLLLNIASISHDPEESDRKEIHEINFNWGELE